LAALASPVPKTAWNTDDLADDVATLSYEHALRTHVRYKPADPMDWASMQPATSKMGASSATQAASTPAVSNWSEHIEHPVTPFASTVFDRNLKRASITIRLSKAECDQLHRRAAEAGLTVSAYLRSCTFEAEALRAQVKEVLTELRTAAAREKVATPTVFTVSENGRAEIRHKSVIRSCFDWLLRFLPRWHAGQRVARA
jgi:predicted DNA binding CopG/RHH family protein